MSVILKKQKNKPFVRVLRLVTRMNIGGPALHTTLLTTKLDEDRYNSLLVSGEVPGNEGNYLDWYPDVNNKLIRMPEMVREVSLINDLKALWKTYFLIRKIRPEIVHTHTAKAGTIGRIAAWLAGTPVIIHTYHGHVLSGYFSKKKELFYTVVERVLAKISTRLITVSAQVREDLLEKGIGHKKQYDVIPLGVPLKRFKNTSNVVGNLREQLGIAEKDSIITIVARLTAIKRHTDLLHAAKMVINEVDNAHILIVGDGEEKSNLFQFVKEHSLTNNVHFLGWRNDLDNIYADSDIVALTSANEGLPVSLIEAMAAGCAIVATKVGGVPELIEHEKSGLVVEPGDISGLANAFLRLLQSSELRNTYGSNAADKAFKHYDEQRLIDDIDSLYQKTLITEGSSACIT